MKLTVKHPDFSYHALQIPLGFHRIETCNMCAHAALKLQQLQASSGSPNPMKEY